MNSETVFPVFGFGHLVVIFLTISSRLLLADGSPHGSRRIDRAVAVCLAFLLATNYLGYAIYLWRDQLLYLAAGLAISTLRLGDGHDHRRPAHRAPGWTEVSYFWGIGGTFQAILTPNLQVNFPDIRAISFFLGHGGIVAGVIYLLIARRFRPTLGSVWRTLAWSQLYLVATLWSII